MTQQKRTPTKPIPAKRTPTKQLTDTLLNVTTRCLKAYGQEVVEQRAVPDYRDGLKPVHRFILWSSYQLGMKYGTPFKKAARTVGDVIGKYSPHGDQATYQAMVNMTGVLNDDGKAWAARNTCVPLIEGYGNWGDNLDNAAAMRYTESRLSNFSTLYLLDPVYLAVSDYLPNFSGDDRVPLVLPAKLPVLLLNGSVSIAFGVSAECPSFAAPGVVDIVKRCLAGETITPKMCAKLLTILPVFGGECISDAAAVTAFHKTGSGSLQFRPSFKCDAKTRTITLQSSCPGLSSSANWATLHLNLSQLKEVRSVSDESDRHGYKFEIVSERNADFEQFSATVLKFITRKYSYSIGVTKRELDKVVFERINVPKLVTDWCAWRVKLEIKALNYLIQGEKVKLARSMLLLLAVNNLKVIIASLSKEDSAAYIAQHLKITLEEANTILDMKVRQLKTLEAAKLKLQIKATETEIQTLSKQLKNPTARVLKEVSAIRIQEH